MPSRIWCSCMPQRATISTGRKRTGEGLLNLMQPCGIHIKLPWGAEHERQRAERLAASFSHVEVLPKLTLAQVAAQLAGTNAVVSVDTGLNHLTAALDRPNITIFGPTDPG